MNKRYNFTGLLLALLISFSLFAESGWKDNEMEVNVFFKNRSEAKQLAKLNLMGDFYTSGNPFGFARLYVTPDELYKIKTLNLQYSIKIPNLNRYYRNLERSASQDDIYDKMNSFVSNYPDLCTKYKYGTSVDGQELSSLKISDNVKEDENEAEILFDAGIHGNEVAGPDLSVRFIEYILKNYGKNSDITELIDTREIWFYCMVNPDGRPRSKTNSNGVDLNRNHGYMVRNGYSEPETRALRDCMLENQFTIQLSYHTGIEYLLFPWCHSGDATPDKEIHSFLADLYSETSGYYNPSKNVQSYYDYVTQGETCDYGYGALGIASITMEISSGSNLNDKYYNANQPSMLKMMEYAGYGVEGMITDAHTKAGIAAVVYVNNYYPIYSDPVVGDYHKYVGEGTYSIKVFANGYKAKTIDNISVQKEKSTKTDFTLEPDPDSRSVYGYKVVFVGSGSGKTPDLLGEPDNKGFSGVFVVDMQYPIKDINGKEFKIHVDGSGSYSVSVGEKIDGPWKSLGDGNGTSEFDLSQAGLASARFVKIDGSATVDAIEATYDYPTSITEGVTYTHKPVQLSVTSGGQNVFINVKNASKHSLEIFNVQGKLCWNVKNSSVINKYTWQPMSTGMYVIRYKSQKDILTKRFWFVR